RPSPRCRSPPAARWPGRTRRRTAARRAAPAQSRRRTPRPRGSAGTSRDTRPTARRARPARAARGRTSSNRHVRLDQLGRLVALGLEVRVVRLVRERHLEVALGGSEPLRGHVQQARHEELAALWRLADLLLLLLLHLLLAVLD